MKILEENKQKIIDEYGAGKTAAQLARDFGVNHWSITNILKKSGIKIRTCSDLRIKYNEDFFIKNSDELHYFWGFVLGDGCLTESSGRKYLTITLHKKDVEILEKFCKYLQIDVSNIKYYKKKYCRLCIYSDYMKRDLSKFGVVHNKTYNPSIPKIGPKYIIPFLLGLIDADGTTAFGYQYGIEIVGHPKIIDWAVEQLHLLGYDGDIKYQFPKNKWKRVRIRRKNDVIDLINILDIKNYKHLLLDRKWSIAYQFLIGDLELTSSKKLDDMKVQNIKSLLGEGKLSQIEIAKMFGVSQHTIGNINTGKSWAHIKCQ